ncbi:unnamed protein product [Protopolystoma xenopodis]|uniref:Uncharacterized protein n=1 Tax=Protopolystoma xenopodis TaxID=117903 RepID=A0A448X8J1_9PLAT|nr:unnamed protein product [Protopolystoma xenopodis]
MKSKPIQNLPSRNKLQLTPALLRRRVGNRNEVLFICPILTIAYSHHLAPSTSHRPARPPSFATLHHLRALSGHVGLGRRRLISSSCFYRPVKAFAWACLGTRLGFTVITGVHTHTHTHTLSLSLLHTFTRIPTILTGKQYTYSPSVDSPQRTTS